MKFEKRVRALKRQVAELLNDELRYAIAERIRELGYIDFRDFFQARPALAHVAEVEYMLRPTR